MEEDRLPGIQVSCPICQQDFVADDAYSAHLAKAHDLVDDAGTTTTLEQAARVATDDAAARNAANSVKAAVVEAAPQPERLDPMRVYEPDDHNPYVGLMGFLVLVIVGGVVALLLSM